MNAFAENKTGERFLVLQRGRICTILAKVGIEFLCKRILCGIFLSLFIRLVLKQLLDLEEFPGAQCLGVVSGQPGWSLLLFHVLLRQQSVQNHRRRDHLW